MNVWNLEDRDIGKMARFVLADGGIFEGRFAGMSPDFDHDEDRLSARVTVVIPGDTIGPLVLFDDEVSSVEFI